MRRCFSTFYFLTLSFIPVMFCFCASSSPLSKSERAVLKSDMVNKKIENRNYTINVTRAYGIRNIDLTSAYSLSVKGNDVDSYLPYFGRAYTVPYGGGEGLIFTGKAENYTLKRGKKDSYVIEFTVQTKEDNYRFAIEVFLNGKSTIAVFPMNKQSITFYGDLNTSE